ncbi:hypothetical protein BGW38_010840, partial [Lunasporangiospora selenospora]
SILSVLRSSTSSNPGNKSSGSSLFPNRNSAGNFNNRNSDFSLFGMSSNSARPTNVTSNPIHLDINHRTQGRSFRVGSMAAADSAYRRLRITLNQSNMKRELRLKRTYETGHRRMRREAQEQNQRLFGKMVRKKIDLIKLMKLRKPQQRQVALAPETTLTSRAAIYGEDPCPPKSQENVKEKTDQDTGKESLSQLFALLAPKYQFEFKDAPEHNNESDSMDLDDSAEPDELEFRLFASQEPATVCITSKEEDMAVYRQNHERPELDESKDSLRMIQIEDAAIDVTTILEQARIPWARSFFDHKVILVPHKRSASDKCKPGKKSKRKREFEKKMKAGLIDRATLAATARKINVANSWGQPVLTRKGLDKNTIDAGTSGKKSGWSHSSNRGRGVGMAGRGGGGGRGGRGNGRGGAGAGASLPSTARPSSNGEWNAPQIMIVGSGLAGLMLAILLERIQVPYLVFERAAKVKPLGEWIGHGANILPVFEQLGLLDEVRKISLPCKRMDIFNNDIERVAFIDATQYKQRSGYDFLMFARPDMHNLLLSQVPEEKIMYSKRVLSIQQNEHGVMIRCADGTSHHGDILVGADGAYSGVRQSLYKNLQNADKLPKSDRENLSMGYISMVGMSSPLDPEKYPVLKEPFSNFSRVIGSGTPRSYNTVSVPGNRICWGMTVQLDTSSMSKDFLFKNSEWGPESNEVMIKEIYDFPSHFGGTIGELIDATPRDLISRVFLEEKLFETWYGGRTVLIGDGAVNALQDAVILANCIYDLVSLAPDDIAAAFKDYQDQRYPQAKYQMEKSKTMAKVLYGQTWGERTLRYVVFKMVPQSAQTEQFLKDTNYRPQLTFLPQPSNRGTGGVLPQKPSRRYKVPAV